MQFQQSPNGTACPARKAMRGGVSPLDESPEGKSPAPGLSLSDSFFDGGNGSGRSGVPAGGEGRRTGGIPRGNVDRSRKFPGAGLIPGRLFSSDPPAFPPPGPQITWCAVQGLNL